MIAVERGASTRIVASALPERAQKRGSKPFWPSKSLSNDICGVAACMSGGLTLLCALHYLCSERHWLLCAHTS
eukprot:5136985-Prymnesium_polylepis.2